MCGLVDGFRTGSESFLAHQEKSVRPARPTSIPFRSPFWVQRSQSYRGAGWRRCLGFQYGQAVAEPAVWHDGRARSCRFARLVFPTSACPLFPPFPCTFLTRRTVRSIAEEGLGVPTAYPNGSVVLTLFQVNRDGGGPAYCDFSTDASLSDASWAPLVMVRPLLHLSSWGAARGALTSLVGQDLNEAGNEGIAGGVDRNNQTLVATFPKSAPSPFLPHHCSGPTLTSAPVSAGTPSVAAG